MREIFFLFGRMMVKVTIKRVRDWFPKVEKEESRKWEPVSWLIHHVLLFFSKDG